LISITKLYQRDSKWYIQGSSEEFDTREEALGRLNTIRPMRQQKKSVEGRRFHSKKLDMYFRSNWEIFVAELLTDLNIEFEFEPKRVYFRAEKESYLYDFYLPEYNSVIEVKGWFDKRSQKRVKLFKKYYGAKYGFFMIMKEEMELLKNNPELIYTYIQIAEEERIRVEKQREGN
jgi:hypothetical protein